IHYAGETNSGQIISTALLPSAPGNSDFAYRYLSINPLSGQVVNSILQDSIAPVAYQVHAQDAAGNLYTVDADGISHYFTKINPTGNIVFQTELNLGVSPLLDSPTNITPLSNGDFIIIYNWGIASVSRLDSLGNDLWTQELPDYFNAQSILQENQDSTLTLASTIKSGNNEWVLKTVHFESDGTIIDTAQQVLFEGSTLNLPLTFAQNGILTLTTDGVYQAAESIELSKFSTESQQLWSYPLPLTSGYQADKVLEISPNRIAVWGQNFNQEPAPVFVSILDTLGNLVHHTEYTIGEYIHFGGVSMISNSRMLIFGHGYDLVGGPLIPFILVTDSLGQAAVKHIHGTLFLDTDADCSLDTVDFPMANWWVGLIDSDTIYRATNSNGEYTFVVNEGTYELTAQLPAALYDYCNPPTIVDVPVGVDSVITEFAVTPLIFCPYLSIDVYAPLLRRCFSNTYNVSYQNQGTDIALGPYAEIELDQYLELISASIPYIPLGGNTFAFELGDLPPGQQGQFTFDAYLSCGDSTILGMAHCVEAHIYPDTLCLSPNPLWSQASLTLNGYCDVDTDSVRFIITNAGSGPMNEDLQYIVIEDDIIMNSTNDPTQLDIGEQYEVALASNGATWRLNVDQVQFHPGLSQPTLAIEGCGTNGNGAFSIGFVTLFPEDEQDPFVSIDCQENIGSFDPNFKKAGFKGYAEEHFTAANQPLEYTIHFQNTGTDTAFTVVLQDQLSPFLDPISMQAGIASHAYTAAIDSTGLATFTFTNILLPDSTTNEAASHGFVKFKIDQIPNNPVGTVITNSADIFFDFNAPITTNTVFHTIGEDFIVIQQFSSTYEQLEVALDVFPNPWAEEATLLLKGMPVKEAQLQVFSVDGRFQHVQEIRDNLTRIQRNELNPGLYYFRIVQGRRTLGTGQFVIAGE
ncbi:MAG: T9SS type A sorting domain-containing protein, partial [Phaeodactylibacter sp.]|nr:T9SS type A sorting domain-containing protein [Phaeodactylibacter sp.]